MIYGCIAEKLGHSFSKDIHGMLFDYSYELREVAKGELDSFMREKDFCAINVTIPYKEDVIPYLDEIDGIARKIGAVNTIVNTNGYLKGYNTDFFGMTSLIEKNGIVLKGKKVLILGSGGTSKTAAAVAEAMESKCVIKVSRSSGNGLISYSDAMSLHSDADVIINTTPVGMYPNISGVPIDIEKFPNLSGIVDAVYNPLRTELVMRGQKKGIAAAGGLYMLVAQAVAAAEKFIRKNIPRSEIDRVYCKMVSQKENIVLTGMPGCGKTTVGRLVADALGKEFIDTDEEIVKKTGRSIPDIFEKDGEKAFRALESSVISDLATLQNVVISTGGGAILNSENVDVLSRNGRVYFLDRDLDSIEATSDRPLSSNRSDLEKRYNERYSLYCERCDVRIDMCNDPEENKNTIVKDFLYENTCNKRT